MSDVLHLIGSSMPSAMLGQLALLAGGGDQIASIGPNPDRKNSLQVQTVSKPFGPALMVSPKLRELSRDTLLIHVWSAELAGIGGEVARDIGCPLVVSLDVLPAGRELIKLLGRVDRCGGLITVTSQADRLRLLASGAEQSLIRVLPPAAKPIDNPEKLRSETRSRLGIPDQMLVLVAPDSLDAGGGQKITIWAYALVRQILPELRLLMPGDGPKKSRARFFAATAGYGKEVMLTGTKFGREELLAAADAAVFFHQTQRGSIWLAQAMAAGKAIAATALGGLVEYAPPGKASLVTQPGSPRDAGGVLLKLLDKAELRSKLGEAAAQIAEKSFDPEVIRSRLDQIYSLARTQEPSPT